LAKGKIQKKREASLKRDEQQAATFGNWGGDGYRECKQKKRHTWDEVKQPTWDTQREVLRHINLFGRGKSVRKPDGRNRDVQKGLNLGGSRGEQEDWDGGEERGNREDGGVIFEVSEGKGSGKVERSKV